jgi:hypothetical protein
MHSPATMSSPEITWPKVGKISDITDLTYVTENQGRGIRIKLVADRRTIDLKHCEAGKPGRGFHSDFR